MRQQIKTENRVLVTKRNNFNTFSHWAIFITMERDSQNFLCKFVRLFVTLGHKILRLFRLKVFFEADIIKG
jgi:hypothetical protein